MTIAEIVSRFIVAVGVLSCVPVDGRAEVPKAQLVAAGLGFPEGPVFVGETLYFVDYARSSVLRLVDGKMEVVWHQPGCGANGLLADTAGLLVACFDSGTIVRISMGGVTLSTISRDDHGQTLVAPNDLVADGRGAVYLTASGSSTVPGKVYRLGAEGRLQEVATGLRFANGIGISPDGKTLYVAETNTGTVLAYPINGDGTLGLAHDLIRLREMIIPDRTGPATPDSLRVDVQGNVLVALYDGGGIAIVSPAGAMIGLVEVPLAHHTNLAISPDRQWLYVTAVSGEPGTANPGQIIRVPNPLAH